MLYQKMSLADELVVKDNSFNWNDKIIIAGPCTFKNFEELYKIAFELNKRGIKFLRAGAYKMRTNPDSFQGLGDEGIEMLLRIKKELNMYIVTEITTIEQVQKYGDKIDIIQIGSRNMFNYELLKAVGRTSTPVLLKRGFCASYHEWLLAAEYILREGNSNVILCERGIRNNISNETRNILDIQAIPYIKNNTNFRILIDPSHSSGKSYMVESMSKASLVAGADGLLIETHFSPEESMCDSEQTINFDILDKILDFKERIIEYEN